MLLVNDPGTWSAIYPPLEHATWNGWTPTDLVFPFFLFIVGITTHLSLSARRARGADECDIRRQILRRGALIFLLGFLLNGFPFFTWGDVSGIADPSFIQRVVDRLYHWRIMGVLQRIGLAYVCAALLTQGASVKRIVTTVGALLLGYWIVMTALPVPGTGGTLGALAARRSVGHDGGLLGPLRSRLEPLRTRQSHLGPGASPSILKAFFSTIPAICTAMLGVLAGRWIGSERPIEERLNGLFAAGCLAMTFGMIWNWGFPINKSIWTSSYVIFTAGLAAVSIATIMWLVDVHGIATVDELLRHLRHEPAHRVHGLGPARAADLLRDFRELSRGANMPLETAIYQSLFASWLSPVNASLAFALCFVGLWYGILRRPLPAKDLPQGLGERSITDTRIRSVAPRETGANPRAECTESGTRVATLGLHERESHHQYVTSLGRAPATHAQLPLRRRTRRRHARAPRRCVDDSLSAPAEPAGCRCEAGLVDNGHGNRPSPSGTLATSRRAATSAAARSRAEPRAFVDVAARRRVARRRSSRRAIAAHTTRPVGRDDRLAHPRRHALPGESGRDDAAGVDDEDVHVGARARSLRSRLPFKTSALRDGELGPDGTLAGNLYLRGSGDPSLSAAILGHDESRWTRSRSWSPLRAFITCTATSSATRARSIHSSSPTVGSRAISAQRTPRACRRSR